MDADARASAAAAEAQWNDTGDIQVGMDEIGGPFEGPEKLLELWFAESVEMLPECQRAMAERGSRLGGRLGLRRVPRSTWESMLDMVKCKTLSVETSDEVDAYLLSESSMFVYPHKLILKTCGTTTLLLGLDRLLRIAKATLFDEESLSLQASSVSSAMLSSAIGGHVDTKLLGSHVKRCFYSRKSFMFPEKQKGPHRDWELETEFLDRYFDHGAAYTVGKMNGDYWMLYMAQSEVLEADMSITKPPRGVSTAADSTLEILMTDLSKRVRDQFYFDKESDSNLLQAHELGARVSQSMQLDTLFARTQLDAFAFEPCGYSANALIPASPGHSDGYWTIHVTPEAGSSYASFETNVTMDSEGSIDEAFPHVSNLQALVHRVVKTFEPGSFIMTLFVTSEDANSAAALRSLDLPGYTKRDRILYEFEGYDLLFLSFQQCR
ncbi:s-adenosylmethionine decarboxylase proenzyme [Malassezia pachydermatis]|uniref:adenosylmethionine decarboxylase n=1 Tax=Malassezia pachydermatis TaxID=77020 RepID=A0A0M9VMN4_9BASI|nr:s-adenosylmethionine decarboxylase proenzyme [Malassezia pachydermatis]KOS12452.1 s-adenosylmethionine decarboxylase proenzyme [Malassezia pachydermatis]